VIRPLLALNFSLKIAAKPLQLHGDKATIEGCRKSPALYPMVPLPPPYDLPLLV